MTEIPPSMAHELSRWNNGDGVDLETWVEAMGNFGLAVGYTTVFWPEFEEFEGYILRKGCTVESLRGFERQKNATRKSVEWVLNHLHIGDLHLHGAAEESADKLVLLGNVLKEVYQAKLVWQFPDRPCVVEFYIPDDRDDLTQYQISFWQKKHEQ